MSAMQGSLWDVDEDADTVRQHGGGETPWAGSEKLQPGRSHPAERCRSLLIMSKLKFSYVLVVSDIIPLFVDLGL